MDKIHFAPVGIEDAYWGYPPSWQGLHRRPDCGHAASRKLGGGGAVIKPVEFSGETYK